MQTPKIINAFFLSSCFVFLLFSCESTIVETQYIPDLKEIKGTVELIRFEQDFFALDSNNIDLGLQKLKEKHPEFATGFLMSVLGVRNKASESRQVLGYLNYKDAQYTYDTVQQIFGALPQVQKELNELASYYQYYFPDATPLSKAFTYLSEYHGDRLAVVEEGFVGLPLDMALGEGYPPYTFLKMPKYDQRTCSKEHLVAKAADAMAQNLVSTWASPKSNHLIDLMLYNGKIFYLTDLLLPTVEDSLLFGFSTTQMNYCKKGELTLYEHISDEELMYSSNSKKINKYVTKGPFKPNFDLPGNSGSWLGYRIILSYAKELRASLKQTQPNLSDRAIDQKVLTLIMEENDPQKFLAKYKPPKL
ncbi:gliding motility protein GldB-related protein [Aureispira anguillae]|uniref:Gliding motility protein GldB n=1 Tax=Aureispira anguillae TaxID=2864201 RepID=A0A916DVX5_9BACT|nr:gliding motility protein GldB [Aureispira anguillae]BDS14050.1 gliding motility protein GldB [Aureispira anguillae]